MVKTKNAKKFKQPEVDDSRKAQRKQKRLQKKVHRQEHYSKKKTIKDQPKFPPGRFVKRPADDTEPDMVAKKKKPKLQPSVHDILSEERDKDIKQANKLKLEMNKRRRDMFVKANEDEDKIIKKLEKQLGLNKSKNKNNYFADDGLDYLLEICDRSTTEQIVAAEKHLAEVEGDSDFEDDLAAVTGKEKSKTDKKEKKNDMHSDESEPDSEMDDDDDDDDDDEMVDDEDEKLDTNGDFSDEETVLSVNEYEETSDLDENRDNNEEPQEKLTKKQKSMKLNDKKLSKVTEKSDIKESESKATKNKERIIKVDELSKVFSDDEISHLSGDDDDDDDVEGFSSDESDEVANKKEEKPDIWEDIYGRKRDKEGNIIKEEKGVYIPPHLRNKDSTSDKQVAQLKRQIKSVLNKLAGSNLHWACTQIENLYSSNSRNSVNTVLTELWLEATVGPASTPDRLVAEHAALVAVLHANVGSEIGAHFLQELVKRFDKMMGTALVVEDKQLDNLVSCLAHLYTFKIYESPLVCDVLSRLWSPLTEVSAASIVAALRGCGGALRRRAAGRLQALLRGVQGAARGAAHAADAGSRIKFLLDVLMAIKNNNLMKIPNYDPTYQEHLTKIIKTVVRKGNYITPLNIGLEDLLKADERGKWWVVGSAWEGSARPDDQAAKDTSLEVTYDQKLLELARKQRMNTDVRRSIFCIIMSAEDYMDAFEKLEHLALKGAQAREVAHVTLACCLQERAYNPYYAALAGASCKDRGRQLSFQFAIWDKIKDLENQTKQCATNLAQFLIHLIMDNALTLSVLKVIQFSDLNKHSVRFMRQILLAIIMNEDLQSSLEVFHRISKSPKLHMFRESLKLFIQHFLVKNAGKKSSVLSDDEMVVLKERAVEVNRILTMFDSKLKF